MGGSILDQTLIFPSIFGEENRQFVGPRLDELEVQSGLEGSPINFCLGPETRPANGHVIWMSDLIRVKREEELGGKGGGGLVSVKNLYYIHVAVAVCEGPISAIKRIWANDRLIYGDGSTELSTGASATDRLIYTVNEVVDGANVTLDPGGGDEESHEVKKVTPQGDGTWEVKLRSQLANTHSSGTIVDYHGETDADNYHIYLGTTSQIADSVIESYEGAGNVPGYRGIAYVVIERQDVTNMGGRLPHYSFEVEADTTPFTVGDALDKILDRAGLDSSQYDTSALTEDFRGFSTGRLQSTVQILQPLAVAYDFGAQEGNGKLTFTARDGATDRTIEEDDLAAARFGEQAPPTFPVTDGSGLELPSEAVVSFVDPTLDYQQGTVRARRIDFPTHDIRQTGLPVTLDSAVARGIAERLLWTKWSERRTTKLVLPPRYSDIQESDLLSVTSNDETYLVRATRVDRGANSLVEVEGVIEDNFVTDMVEVGQDAPRFSRELPIGGDLKAEFLNLPAIQEDQTNTAGFFLAVERDDPEDTWEGATTYIYDTATSGWTPLTLHTLEATQGIALTTLADGPIHYWDEGNTVDVEITIGSLSSKTKSQVLNGGNAIVIGDEVLQYRTATLIGTGTNGENQYRLSGLLRGRRGTDWAVGLHSSSEDVVVLDSTTGFQFVKRGATEIQQDRTFRVVPEGKTINDVSDIAFTMTGENVLPFSPCGVRGYRNSSSDLIIKWNRRSRGFARMFDAVDAPNHVAERNPGLATKYRIQVMNGAAVARQITVSDATTYTYSVSQQTADFGSPQSNITIRISQLDNKLGPGHYRERTL
jgi:hypothetical protein